MNNILSADLAPTPRLALRAPDAAAALSLSERTLAEHTKAGTIPHFRLGGCLMYSVDALREWLIEQSNSSRSADGDVTSERRNGAKKRERPAVVRPAVRVTQTEEI